MESLNIDSSSFLPFQLTMKTDQPDNFIKLIYCKPCITRNCKYSKKFKKKMLYQYNVCPTSMHGDEFSEQFLLLNP